MTEPLDYVEYLSKEIGARPAGTEEEQQAALYIADEFQDQADFAATIEEFTSSSNLEGGRAILSMITIVVSVLAILFNVLTAPAFFLAVIAAVIYALEVYDKPFVSSMLARGASQNVIAKYQPFANGADNPQARKRKIVLVAHYDTGKVTPRIIQRIESMNLPLSKVCLVGMIAAAFFLLLRIFVAGGGGAGLIFINLLTVIAIIVVALPVVKAILYRVAPYNEGANNNATGVAALIEVAKRINSGSMSEADLLADEPDAVVHGEQAAREEGLVPEGVDFSYDHAIGDVDDEDASDEERLLAAKAAIAALTGAPVDRHIYAEPRHEDDSYEDDLEQWAEPVEQIDELAPYAAEPVEPEPFDYSLDDKAEDQGAGGFENAPSWFLAAQRNAKKSESAQPVQRSRYTEAITAAEQEMAAREQARLEEERLQMERERQRREAEQQAAIDALRLSAQNAARAEAKESAPLQPTVLAEDVLAPEEGVFEAAFEAAEPGLQEVEELAQTAYSEADQEEPEQAPEQAPAVGESREEPEPAAAPEPVAAPGLFEDRLDAEVDLGSTIAYTPDMIRQALAEVQGDVQPASQDVAADEPLQEESSPARLHLADLPQVEPETSASNEASRTDLIRQLRNDVPSLSAPMPPLAQSEPAAIDPLKSAQLPKIELEEPAPAAEVDYDMEVPLGLVEFDEEAKEDADEGRSPAAWEGGAFSRVRLGHVDTRSGVEEENADAEELAPAEDPVLNEEIEQIYHFRNPLYNSEIWFVAIGSDTEMHDGAKAFVDAHRSELRGAVVIELESLGVGELCYVSEEGSVRKMQASSRIKRFTRGAAEATGIVLGQVRLATDSISTVLQKSGLQVMHIMGVEDGRPALKGSADDIFENVEELVFEENINYIMELLKQD